MMAAPTQPPLSQGRQMMLTMSETVTVRPVIELKEPLIMKPQHLQ